MQNKNNHTDRKNFPKKFYWGAASSAYQVEGGIENNDWAVSKDRIATAGEACDHWNRYENDFDLAFSLGHNAHRFSLEWSRIEPAEGQYDERALHHYAEVIRTLRSRRLEPFLTLHHFTNPTWFAEKGGWTNPKAPEIFTRMVGKVCQSIGAGVNFWITINEPGVYATLSYLQGNWPPFVKSFSQAYQVYKNMLAAHDSSYRLIHKYYPEARVGFAQNIALNDPDRPGNPLDYYAAKILDYMSIEWPFAGRPMDFIGLNHYFHNYVHFGLGRIDTLQRGGEMTDKQWEIYPRAIYEVLKKLKKFNLPVFVTENGLSDRHDHKRSDYIHRYLGEVHRAIADGIDVQGYFYWSLTDNYEWPTADTETGYEQKFGLIDVNFADQSRHVRGSARDFEKICRQNALISEIKTI